MTPLSVPALDDFYPDGRPILAGPTCRYCKSQNLACLERAERADDGFEFAAYRCTRCQRVTTFCTHGGKRRR